MKDEAKKIKRCKIRTIKLQESKKDHKFLWEIKKPSQS